MKTMHLLPGALWCLVAMICHADIIANGDFDRGTTGWIWSQQEQARGTFDVVSADSPAGGQAARIKVTAPGPAHRLQLMCTFDNSALTSEQGYVLSFFAKATQPTSFQVLLMNRDRPWQNLGVRRQVSLDTKWKHYRYVFRARKSTQPYGKIDFFLGQATGTVLIDGVAIEPADLKAMAPDGPTLNAGRYTIQFFKSGAIGRLVPAAKKAALIVPGVDDTAYELTVEQNNSSALVSSRDARNVRAVPLPNGSGYQFIAQHDGFIVTIEYRLDPATGLIECRSAIDNHSDVAITQFTFPMLHCPDQLGTSSADDTLLYPAFDGCVVDDPKSRFRATGRSFAEAYPGPLSCQVMAYCDPSVGLYVACHDPDGYPKQFLAALPFHLQLAIVHKAPQVAGADWRISYPVVIGPFVGDRKKGGTSWYDAAAIYRNWSQRQRWAERKVQSRADTPAWLRAGALVTYYDPRQLTAPGDAARLAAMVSDYTTRFGAPVLPNNRGFERYGTWCGQEYLPVRPDEATFRQSAEVVRQLGGRSMIMLSGYRWTIERTAPGGEAYSSRTRFDREVAPWAIHDRSGKPIITTSDKPNDWHGRVWSRMCRDTDYAKQTIVDLSKYFVRNGYSVVHFDQECSGAYAASVCWSKNHGHPPGDGRWVHLAMADLYQRICNACRPLDSDFMLSMEEPNELYLPWLNLCQSRPFGITSEWPVVAPGTRSVPLFLYLYHENLICWAAFYPWKSAGRPSYSVAKGFAIGQMPGLAAPSNVAALPVESREPFMTLLVNCMRAYRGFAHDYLTWGRMEKPLALDVPIRTFTLANGDTVRVPAIAQAVWRLADGRVGVVLVNAETEPHTVAVDVSAVIPAPASGTNTMAPTVQVLSATQPPRTLSGPRCSITIAPLDFVLVGREERQEGRGER